MADATLHYHNVNSMVARWSKAPRRVWRYSLLACRRTTAKLSLGALQTCVTEPWVDSVHARINAYGEKMDGPTEKVAPVLKALHEAGKGVVGMKLIGEGTFRNSDEKRDESVRYVLGLGAVDAMVVGFEKIEEVDDFAARVRKVAVADAPDKLLVRR